MVTDRACPLLRSACGMPIGGPNRPIVCAAVRREVLGPGSQERYPRVLRIHLLPGELVSLGAQGTRRLEGGKQLEDRPWLHLILDELPRFVWIHFASGNAMNSNLQRRLKALADNFKGPLGPIPLDRAVRRHRGLFEEFRDEGFTWSQIARALAAAGIRRADGSSFSADRLRGAVSRQMKVTASAPTGQPGEDSTPLRTAAPEEKASSGSRTGETTAPRARKTVAVKPVGGQKPDQPTAVSRSIQDKLSRVAKLRGG